MLRFLWWTFLLYCVHSKIMLQTKKKCTKENNYLVHQKNEIHGYLETVIKMLLRELKIRISVEKNWYFRSRHIDFY